MSAITYESETELLAKLHAIAAKLGYRLEPIAKERISVGELARRVNRSVASVSRSLRRPNCPAFTGRQGKRRLLWLEPTDALLAHLRTRTAKSPQK